MARRMIRRSSRRVSRGRRLVWARELVANQQFTDTNMAVFDDLLSGFETVLGADANGVTITRIRGELGIQWTLANGTAPTFRNFSFGIRVADVAALTGTDAEQRQYLPNSRPYSDWMYSRNFPVMATAADATADARVASTRLIDIDVRSQRNIHELQQTLTLFSGPVQTLVAPETVTINYDLNILLRKP